jgi:heat shock protein HtpX
MNFAKRIFLFLITNILIVATLSVVMSLLGVQPYLEARGLNYQSLLLFCLVWGFGGAFISLAISRKMAKWMMGVKVIDPKINDPGLRSFVNRVHELSRKAGLQTMPEVGVYNSPELNAFATGPTRNHALVAVSSGLLEKMSASEIDGVLAHEVAHIANGDMVTMTLVQGVVNSLVMFMARIIAFFVSQTVEESKRHAVHLGVLIAAEILLGMLGMMVVASFSRYREYRADAGGAQYAGRSSMVSALEKLKMNYQLQRGGHVVADDQPAIASLKISGKPGRFFKLFSTHPDIDDRIARLKSSGASQAFASARL